MVDMYGVWRSFNLLPCGVAMVMEMVRCIDDLNGVGWMISGRGISYASSQITMMICTMILERRDDNIYHLAACVWRYHTNEWRSPQPQYVLKLARHCEAYLINFFLFNHLNWPPISTKTASITVILIPIINPSIAASQGLSKFLNVACRKTLKHKIFLKRILPLLIICNSMKKITYLM